jgi:phage replication initiation protein
LAFTVPPAEERDWFWLRRELEDVCGLDCRWWESKSRKWSGYRYRLDAYYPGERGERVHLGLAAWGGESQRGTLHVSLNGQGAAHVEDFGGPKAWGGVKASITRVDVAYDDFEGRTVDIETARRWYGEGGFTSSGRPPTAELIDDLGSGRGKTFYVGNRGHGKLCRVYEKGRKEGDPTSPWVRVEVEWRNKNREIPWEFCTFTRCWRASRMPGG